MRTTPSSSARASRGFSRSDGVEVLGQAGTGDELVRLVAADPPDVAVVDIRMPPTYTNEGLVAAQEIRATFPRVGRWSSPSTSTSSYALKLVNGSSERVGYLLKDRVGDVNEFVERCDESPQAEPSSSRRSSTSSSLPRLRAIPSRELTPREREVLVLIAEGKTDRGIADELFVTRKTVEAHVRSILRKLDLPADARENRRVHAVLAFLGATEAPTDATRAL